jgi:hypothetical protein
MLSWVLFMAITTPVQAALLSLVAPCEPCFAFASFSHLLSSHLINFSACLFVNLLTGICYGAAMPTPPQKVARKRMEKRPMVEVPEDVHQALKVHAALHRTQVKAVVEEALRAHLKKLEKKT